MSSSASVNPVKEMLQVFSRNKSLLLIAFVMTLGLITLLTYAGASSEEAQPEVPLLVNVSTANIDLQLSYKTKKLTLGVIETKQKAVVAAERSGTLINLMVEQGQAVTKGQVLGQLDTLRLDAEINQSQATLVRVKAEARLAKRSEQRVQSLFKEKLVSQQELDSAKESSVAANALVNEVEASLERLAVEKDKSNIIAPFTGILDRRLVSLGSTVNLGAALFELVQADQLQVRFALGQAFADVVSQSDKWYITQLNQPEQLVPAEFVSIAPVRNLLTRTVDVIFKLNDSALRPGDLLTLVLDREVEQAGIWLPTTALIGGTRGLWKIYLIDRNGAEAIAKPVQVQVQYTLGGQSFVSGPLFEQQEVVIAGHHKLVPYQSVSTQPVAQPFVISNLD